MKEDIENLSGSSQYFTFLSSFLEKKSKMLSFTLRSKFLHHLSKLESKFTKYFPENYQAINGFTLLNKKKNTILTLPVIVP